MRFIARRTELAIDRVREVTDIGELTKLGTVLGYSVVVEPDPQEPARRLVRFIRSEGDEAWGSEELANLAVIRAYAEGVSGKVLVERLEHELRSMCLPFDRPIQDVMEIGRGHDHTGHE
jgi:hypothetical protein